MQVAFYMVTILVNAAWNKEELDLDKYNSINAWDDNELKVKHSVQKVKSLLVDCVMTNTCVDMVKHGNDVLHIKQWSQSRNN